MLYMKIGVIIVGTLLGNAALGIYAAAIRVPEAANFIPMVLASSLLPGLVKSRERSAESYNFALLRYLRINMLIASAICVPLTVGAVDYPRSFRPRVPSGRARNDGLCVVIGVRFPGCGRYPISLE